MFASPPDPASPAGCAYRHRYIILSIVLIDSIMANLDSSMVNIVLPTITEEFHATLAASQWVVTAYLLTMSSLFIICGKISEKVGACRLFTAGSIVFTLGSLLCGLAGTIPELILFRMIQALGSSMVAGIGTVIIFRVFPAGEIGRALGYSGSVFSVCSMCGPALGGIINDLLGWSYIFFINVPIGICLLLLNMKYLKVPEIVPDSWQMDWTGAAALIGTIVFFSLACGELGTTLSVTAEVLICTGLFLLCGLFFVRYESGRDNPLLDLSIFRNSRYTIPVISSLLLGIANYSLITLLPFYFEGALGMASIEIGMILMINPVVQVFASGTTGWIIDRYHWKYLSGFGLLVVAGAGCLMGLALFSLNIVFILLILVLRGIGASLFQGQKSIDVMTALPKEQAATASSVSTTAGCLGASLGVTLAALLITACLSFAGYHGPVLAAGSGLLSWSAGWVIIGTGALCVIGAVLSILRNRTLPSPEEHTP